MTSTASQVTFPEGFDDLGRLSEWVLWTEEERVEKQVNSSVEKLAEFYDAMLPRAAAIYDHLATVDLDRMNDEDRALLCLAVAFAEIANGVEYYSPESTAAEAMPRFRSSHDPLFGWSPAVSGRAPSE